MRVQVFLVAGTMAAILAGPAAAQVHEPREHWSRFATPQSPKPPAAPYTPSSPGFKPFKGTSVYSSPAGEHGYPSAAKPKSPATSLFGPEKPRRRGG